ncbi:MAG: isoprenylcysteine carboxylmethyltransferase family protein [Chloroflexi bacterium]|nr:isoprenylcysteine carboxylmethyltransferase family protein [Chloroflexota bacterium]
MKLFLKVALFTLVVPGTIAVLVPLLIKWDRPVAEGPTLWLGVCLLALGTLLYLRSVWDFAVSGGGTPAPIDAPKRLVTNGIYRYSRNPIYVAVLIAIAGWTSLFQAPLLLVYGGALFALYSFFVQRHEEPHLAREFGEEYTAYKASTGRWLPRLRRKNRL